ncbi:site-specific integrase (plasmid) [Aliivibrio salmonicida]|uniref:site-specific integrase n=1 Tax=Aliivibrio salmonicida TaxID=40269 RepID=UPI000F6F07C6|nr:site-specific integrase [Aliivibrio salmonicida]AZL83321.1 site-specific integrase [Aliivibrio salmonicida]
MNNHSISYDEWEHLIQLNLIIENKWNVVTKLALELMVHAGLRTNEIALLQIGDVLTLDNKIKNILIVPSSISFNGKQRPVSLRNKHLISSIILYFEYLSSLSDVSFSRISPLLMNPLSAKGFDVHKRGLKANGTPKFFSLGLNDLIDKVLCKHAINGISLTRKMLINTFISNSYSLGYSVDEISLMSGISGVSINKVLIHKDKKHSELISWWRQQLKSNTVRFSDLCSPIELSSIIKDIELEPSLFFYNKAQDYEIECEI